MYNNNIAPKLVYFQPPPPLFPQISPLLMQPGNVPPQRVFNSFSIHPNLNPNPIPPPLVPERIRDLKTDEKIQPHLLKSIQSHQDVVNARPSSLKDKKINYLERQELEAPLRHLNRILAKQDANSATNRLFHLVRTYKQITFENFLPWRIEFVQGDRPYCVDGILSHHLTQTVMWSIDPWERPFVTFIYCYRKLHEPQVSKRQSYTLIQRYIDSGENLIGGMAKKKLKFNTTDSDTLFNDLEELLQSGYVYRKRFNKSQQVEMDYQICLLSNIRNKDLFTCADRSKYAIHE